MRPDALIALVLCTTALAPEALAGPHRSRRARGRRPPLIATAVAPQPESVSERRLRMLDAFARSGHIQRCWRRQLQRDATTAARTLRVTLLVGAQGRTRGVTILDRDAPELARCLAAGAWTLAPVGAGEPFSAEGTLHLDRPD